MQHLQLLVLTQKQILQIGKLLLLTDQLVQLVRLQQLQDLLAQLDLLVRLALRQLLQVQLVQQDLRVQREHKVFKVLLETLVEHHLITHLVQTQQMQTLDKAY